jgi:hypothetical protein
MQKAIFAVFERFFFFVHLWYTACSTFCSPLKIGERPLINLTLCPSAARFMKGQHIQQTPFNIYSQATLLTNFP